MGAAEPIIAIEDPLAGLRNQIFNEDCLEGMKRIPDGTIDLVIADPPYFQVYGDFDFVFKNEAEYLGWCRQWLNECKRILKPSGTLMLWGSVGKRQITFARLAIMIEDEGIFERQNWITQKNTRGIGTKQNYMSCREDLLFLTKDAKAFTFNIPYLEERSTRKDLGKNGKPRKNEFKRVSNVWSDITEASQSSVERCDHPTVKAQRLCDRIILSHSNIGETVFIPFVGAGSEIISASKNGRSYIGTELDEKYFHLAVNRISSMLAGGES